MVHRPLSPLRRRDDGAVAILTILLTSVVFIGLCTLVVDLGLARDTRRQAQNAADASVLAAGNVLYGSDGTLNITGAVAAAKAYARTNYNMPLTDWTDPLHPCPDASALPYHVPGDTECITFGPNSDGSAPTQVRVNVPRRDVSTPFAGIWGVSSVPVSAVAEIGFDTGGKAKCGLCVIGPGLPPNEHDLKVGTIFESGGADVTFNGPLVSNNAHAGITVSDGGSIGLQQALQPSNGTFTPTPNLTQLAILDPLAGLTMPNYTDPTKPNYSALTVHANTNTCPAVPGIYDHLSDCGGIAMGRGLYVLTGSANINGNIVANGVTLYFVCGTYRAPRACNSGGESGGSLTFAGNNTLTITAPAAPEANPGLAIVSDRNNTATISFRGSQTTSNTGTIYAKSGTLDVKGDATVAISDSLVVVGNLTFSGTVGVFHSTYTKEKNVTVPPSSMHLSR